MQNKYSSKIDIEKERLKELTNELDCCKVILQNERSKVKILEEQLLAKTEEIKLVRSEENNALIQMMNYKDESGRLANKIKMLQKSKDKSHFSIDSDLYTNATVVQLEKKNS